MQLNTIEDVYLNIEMNVLELICYGTDVILRSLFTNLRVELNIGDLV